MAAEMIAGVNPTRMELLKIRKRVKLAQKGHRLLKEKRDALIMEFFSTLEKARKSRKELNASLATSYQDLVLAEATAGMLAVRSTAYAVRDESAVNITNRNIMGVFVPTIEKKDFSKKLSERGYGFVGTPAKLDEAAESFESSANKVMEVAEIEGSLLRLAEAIQKTKRRVNSLEYILIPRLKNTGKHIQMKLDEMSRESFFRLKKIKKKLTEK